jgi:SAM-dependent methyltransferase
VPTSEERTIEAFGREWAAFDHAAASPAELADAFAGYFAIFPWDALPPDAEGFDLGCGTGRWARFVAPRVGRLHCVEASQAALEVAARNLAVLDGCQLVLARAGALPFPPASMDFGYALGVLHHLDDPDAALADAVAKLRPGAPFLAYVYYALDGRPRWFRGLWRASDALRRVVSRLPFGARRALAEPLAVLVYWPLARLARRLEAAGVDVGSLPLAAYRHRTLYVMRADALDRFGTRVERRFTRAQAVALLERAGLEGVAVSPEPPYWCLVGRRAA